MPPVAKPGCAGQCFRYRVGNGSTKRPLGALRLGRRVPTWRTDDAGYEVSAPPSVILNTSELRAVWLVQHYTDGEWLRVGLLRSVEWLRERGIGAVGDRCELELPEQGAEGLFEVESIEACPEIEAGEGCLITGEFHHSRGEVYDLWVEGEPEAIGVTLGHPSWSVDRLAWVPVGELHAGERVQAEGRTVPVQKLGWAGYEPVVNFEVEGDHCYRVGEQGILVHNVSSSNLDAVKQNCRALASQFGEWTTSDHVRVISNRSVGATLNSQQVLVSEITRVLFAYDSSQTPPGAGGNPNITGTPGEPTSAGGPRYQLARAYVVAAVRENLGQAYPGRSFVAGHVITSQWGGTLDINGDHANIVPLPEPANSLMGGGGPGMPGVYGAAENDLRSVFNNSCLACVVIEFDWRRSAGVSLRIPDRFRVDVFRLDPPNWLRDPNRGWVQLQW